MMAAAILIVSGCWIVAAALAALLVSAALR